MTTQLQLIIIMIIIIIIKSVVLLLFWCSSVARKMRPIDPTGQWVLEGSFVRDKTAGAMQLVAKLPSGGTATPLHHAPSGLA